MSTTIWRSNIFGGSDARVGTTSAFSPNSTDAAGRLIERLQWIADNRMSDMEAANSWLGIASQHGQEVEPAGLVRNPHKKPDKVTRSTAFAAIPAAAMPTLPSFPTLPDDLKIDVSKLNADMKTEIEALKSSWVAQHVPGVTDVSQLNNLFKDTLNGSATATATSALAALETDLKGALNNISTKLKNELDTGVSTMKANLDTRTGLIDSKIAASLAIATDNTQNIAWARARDQAVSEGARQEREVSTLWASRGFSIPPGALAAQVAYAGQSTTSATVVIAAEQAMRSQGLYLDVAQRAVEAWVTATQLQISSEIEEFKTVYAQRFAVAELETQQNREKVRQAFEHLGLRLDFTKFSGDLAVKYRLGVNQAVSSLIQAYASLAGTKSDYLAKIASAQQQSLGALVDYYRVALQSAEVGMKLELANNETDLKFADVSANFIVNAVKNHIVAAQATADMYARAASMALSGINGVASIVKEE